jgi:hypothetical protein
MRASEEPRDNAFRFLIGEYGMRTEAFDLRLWAVAAPGETIAGFRPAQIDYLKAFVELAREVREDGVLGPETLFVGKNPWVRLPHVGQPVPVNIVDKALVRRLEHPEQLIRKCSSKLAWYRITGASWHAK